MTNSVQDLDLIRVTSCQSAPTDLALLPTMVDINSQSPERGYPKNGTGAFHRDSIDLFNHEESYAKWRKLTLVVKSINRFRTPKVERIGSIVRLFS